MEMIQKLRSSGVFWMITSACAFSLMQVFIKLTSASVSVYLQVLFRNVVGILISAIYIKKEQLLWFGSKQEQLFLFGRSIAGFLGLVTFFYASRLGNVADVTIVNRTGPFFTTLFSVIFLKERAGAMVCFVHCFPRRTYRGKPIFWIVSGANAFGFAFCCNEWLCIYPAGTFP